MKRSGVLLSALFISSFVFFASCGDDEIPKSTIGFEEIEMDVKEADPSLGLETFHPLLVDNAVGREITIAIPFDRPAHQTTVIGYSVSGTATKNSTTNPIGDYEIVGNGENFTIEKGATSAEITIKIYEDYDFELDDNNNLFETVIITLEDVVSGKALIGENSTFTLNILEDDAAVILDWDADGGADPFDRGDVDMDLLLSSGGDVIWGSASPGNDDAEVMVIPAGFPNGNYGLSYTYYSGTSDDVEFYSLMYNFGGTLNGSTYNSLDDDPLEFVGNYKLVNINPWADAGGADPAIVQTMVKSGFNYSSISTITEPTSGSRVALLTAKSPEKRGPSKLSKEKADRIIKYLGLR